MIGSFDVYGVGLLVVILIVGSVGTIAVLVLLQRNKSQDTTFTNLIRYVTISDLAVVLGVCITELKFHRYFRREWPYGDALCRIKSLLPEMVITFNSFMLVLFAIEGVLTVTRTVLPKKPKVNNA